VEKSPCLNLATQFFTVAPCVAGKKKLDDSSHLDDVEIARVA
jgi:hypothetical protein